MNLARKINIEVELSHDLQVLLSCGVTEERMKQALMDCELNQKMVMTNLRYEFQVNRTIDEKFLNDYVVCLENNYNNKESVRDILQYLYAQEIIDNELGRFYKKVKFEYIKDFMLNTYKDKYMYVIARSLKN